MPWPPLAVLLVGPAEVSALLLLLLPVPMCSLLLCLLLLLLLPAWLPGRLLLPARDRGPA